MLSPTKLTGRFESWTSGRFGDRNNIRVCPRSSGIIVQLIIEEVNAHLASSDLLVVYNYISLLSRGCSLLVFVVFSFKHAAL